MRILPLLLALAACSAPVTIVPPAPVAEPVPAVIEVPRQVRAALVRAEPREHALAASPRSDGDDIALVRLLHHNVLIALAELERDGGRHATPAAIARAKTALKDLQHHLDEFQAASKAAAATDGR
jgi:hypothetical protein